MSIESEFFRQYHDRGMLKWMGFYLSEHTAALSKEKSERNLIITGKAKMELLEIEALLEQAFRKDMLIAIQLDEKDLMNQFKEDIIGKISGIDESMLYVGTVPIELGHIRHVEILNAKKWSNLD